ncbi:hypothetical protein [Fusibacter tunisiensis]|uniref:Uncharacterized protein n=1 Tax=Fusibacter tunisiensis TaxID=1008308 RepID=A0ABS2MSV9_9FIRM|nr:hypothetical protein [Fusibacter tunisiensis]MBM7562492.1 hypothetical protein [Fusibacter tunisiensis]
MRKILMLFLSAVLIFGSIPVFGEISERELRTLEGSYQFDVSFENADLVNTMLKMDYKVSTPITGDLMAHSFVLDVKYKDGEMLLYDRGLLIDNSGMASNNELFFFRFFYEVPDASIPGIGYQIEGSVAFDDSFN